MTDPYIQCIYDEIRQNEELPEIYLAQGNLNSTSPIQIQRTTKNKGQKTGIKPRI